MSENKKLPVVEALEKVNQASIKELREKHELEHEVSKLLGGQEYDVIRLINETKFFLEQHVLDGIEAGRRLYLIKRKENHGNFLKILEEDIGIKPRVAQNYMAIFIKFGLNNPNTHALSYLGKAKLIAALNIPDEEIEKLDRDGSLLGFSKEELKILSVREFQAEIKKWQKRTGEVEKREEKLKEDVNRLQNRLDNLFNPDAEDIEKEVRDKMTGHFLSIKGTLVFARKIADLIYANPDKFPESCRAQTAGFADLVMRVATEFWHQLYELTASPYGAEEIGDVENWKRPIAGEWNPQLVPEAHDGMTIEEYCKDIIDSEKKK